MGKHIITVDLGGTKILSALINNKNEIIERVKTPTVIANGADAIVKDIADSIKELLKSGGVKESDVKAVALGVPGTVNPFTGVIGNAPNLNITDYNIKKALKKHTDIPVLIENDVNLTALGIKKFEFDDKVNNMLVAAVGTGIGSALVFNGAIYRGSSFYAGEIGHMKVSANGSMSGGKMKDTFEGIASRTAIAENIKRDIKSGKKSVLKDIVETDKKIKSKALRSAVEENDKVAVKHLTDACKVIGSVLGSITTLLNIDTIVLGGGVIEALSDFMLPNIEKSFKEAVLKEPGEVVKIVATKLGDDAPLLGGIALTEEFVKD